MTNINIQQLTNTQKVDDTNDIAGGASVSPSYIASDVPSVFDPSASVGIDNVAVSNGVSTSQVTTGSAVDQNESSNYIQSDVPSGITVSVQTDGYDMNSIPEIEGAEQYIDPSASGVQLILSQMRTEGVITSGMTNEQIVAAISNYVHTHFSYIADPSGSDHWNLVSQTINNGGGDCEDLANLTASLAIAALMSNGMTLDDANKTISCVAIVDPNAMVGHVIVQFTGDNGSVKYFDPTAGTISNSIGGSKIVLFSYNTEGVDLSDKNYDYSKFSTAQVTIPDNNIQWPLVNFANEWTALNNMKNCIKGIIDDLDFYSAAPDFDWSSLGGNISTDITDVTNANDYVTAIYEYALQDIEITVDGVDQTASAKEITKMLADGVTFTYKTTSEGTAYTNRLKAYNTAKAALISMPALDLSADSTYDDLWAAADANQTTAKAALQLEIWTQLGLCNYYDPSDGLPHNLYNELYVHAEMYDANNGTPPLLDVDGILDPAKIAKINHIITVVQTVLNQTIGKLDILAKVSNLDLLDFNPTIDWAELGVNVAECMTTLDDANSIVTYLDQYTVSDIAVAGSTTKVSAQWIQAQIAAGHKVYYANGYMYMGENIGGYEVTSTSINGPFNIRKNCYEGAKTYLISHGLTSRGTITYQDYVDVADNFQAAAKSHLQLAIFTALGLADKTSDDYYQIYGSNGIIGQLNNGTIPANETFTINGAPITVNALIAKVEKDIQTKLNAWVTANPKSGIATNDHTLHFGGLDFSKNSTFVLASAALAKVQKDYSDFVSNTTKFNSIYYEGSQPTASQMTYGEALEAYFAGGDSEYDPYYPEIYSVTVYKLNPTTNKLDAAGYVKVADGTTRNGSDYYAKYSAADIDYLIENGYTVMFMVSVSKDGKTIESSQYKFTDGSSQHGLSVQEINSYLSQGYYLMKPSYTNDSGVTGECTDYLERHANYFNAIEHKTYLQTCVNEAGKLAAQFPLLEAVKSAGIELANAPAYYNSYIASQSTTPSFINSMYSMIAGAEYEMGLIDDEVMKMNMALSVLSADAAVVTARAACNDYYTGITKLNGLTYATAVAYPVDPKVAGYTPYNAAQHMAAVAHLNSLNLAVSQAALLRDNTTLDYLKKYCDLTNASMNKLFLKLMADKEIRLWDIYFYLDTISICMTNEIPDLEQAMFNDRYKMAPTETLAQMYDMAVAFDPALLAKMTTPPTDPATATGYWFVKYLDGTYAILASADMKWDVISKTDHAVRLDEVYQLYVLQKNLAAISGKSGAASTKYYDFVNSAEYTSLHIPAGTMLVTLTASADAAGFSSPDLDVFLNTLIGTGTSAYITKTAHTDYDGDTYFTYSLNLENTELNPNSPTSVMTQMRELRGLIVALAIIYEAKRDMRGLVQQELDGESYGYKGMAITKLFTTKVDSIMKFVQDTVSKLLQTISDLNKAQLAEENSKFEKTYNDKIADIDSYTPGICDPDHRESDKVAAEKLKDTKEQTVKTAFEAADEMNLKNAKALLASCATKVTGGTLSEILGSVDEEINNAVSGADYLARYTLSATDDPQYLEPNYGLHKILRSRIVGAFGIRRVALMAKQALSDMRSLVHQEMTGIGGRKSDIDAAAKMNEADLKQATTFFDEVWTETESVISDKNTLRYNELQITKLTEDYNAIRGAEDQAHSGNIWSWVGLICDVVGEILQYIPYCGAVGEALMVVGAICSAVGSIMTSDAKKAEADALYDVENDSAAQVIVFTENNTAAGRTLEITPDAGNKALDDGSFQLTLGGNITLSADQKTVYITTATGTVRLAVDGTKVKLSADGKSILIASGGDVKVATDKNIEFVSNGTSTVVTLNSPDQGTASENYWLNMAQNSEQNIREIENNMTADNYLVTMDDGHPGSYAGSSAFDTVKFGSAMETISGQDIQILIANSVKATMAEMRNLVHMEMTGIGGREPSNMVTYAVEAARMQESAIVSGLFTQLYDINTSNNLRFQRDQKLRLLSQAKDSADSGFWWSLVSSISGMSIIGTISNTYTTMTDLNNQKDQYEETANAVFTTDAEFSDAELNGLFDPTSNNYALISTGNGKMGVDYQKIANARARVTEKFIAADVQASIHKALRQMRSLVHEEMTGIQSSTGGGLSDEVNMIIAQSAMDSISMLTEYLVQEADIQNRVAEANTEITKLNGEIAREETAAVIAGIEYAFGAGYDSSLAGTIASLIMSIANTWNAWEEYWYDYHQAQDDLGQIETYLHIKETLDADPNSVTSRLEDLENQCIDEIGAGLLQDLGAGYIGVNRSMAAKYNDFIERLYRAENEKAKLREVLQELRSIVHQTMTGISSVTSDVSSEILRLKEQEVMAKINDMFQKLEVLCQRWNQITEAEMAAEMAKIQAIMATINLAIQALEVAVTIAMKAASGSGDNGGDGEGDNGEGGQGAKTSQVNLQALSNLNSLVLPSLEILAKLIVMFVGKKMMQNVQARREGKVAGEGITTGAKSSNVMAASMLGGDYGATVETASGQVTLDDQAAIYQAQTRGKIESTFVNNWMDIRDNIKQLAIAGANKIVGAAGKAAINHRFEKMVGSMKSLNSDQAKAVQQAFKDTMSAKHPIEALQKELKSINTKMTNIAPLTEVQGQAVLSAAEAALSPNAKTIKAATDAINVANKAAPVAEPVAGKPAANGQSAGAKSGEETPAQQGAQAVPAGTTKAAPGTVQTGSQQSQSKDTRAPQNDPSVQLQEPVQAPAAAPVQAPAAAPVQSPAATPVSGKSVKTSDTKQGKELSDKIAKIQGSRQAGKAHRSSSASQPAATTSNTNPVLGKLLKRLEKMPLALIQNSPIFSIIGSLKNLMAAAQGVQAAQQFASAQTFTASDKQSTPNMTSLAQWIDKLSADIDKLAQTATNLTTEIGKSQAEAPTGSQPQNIEDLKNYLEVLKKQLDVAVKELSAAKAELTGMKNKVPEAQRAIAALADVLKIEKEKRVKDIKDVEDKIKALEELGAKNPGSRSVIEKQAVALNKSLVDMQRSFASIQEKYDLAKHAANSLNDGIKAVEGKMAQTKETIGNIKGEIKQVQTALTKLKNDKADHAGANNINVQTDDLLAQLHGKSPVFSKVH